MERIARSWLAKANDAFRRQDYTESLAASAIAKIYLLLPVLPDDEQPDHVAPHDVARWEDDGGRWVRRTVGDGSRPGAASVELGGEG